MYLRDTDSDELTDNVSSEKNISTLDVVAAIMEMDVPMAVSYTHLNHTIQRFITLHYI